MAVNQKCAECEENDHTHFCERCAVYFCDNHITTHLKTILCIKCNKDICKEFFEHGMDDNICFHCATIEKAVNLHRNAKQMTQTARRVPLPPNILDAKQILEARKNATEFEKNVAEMSAAIINRFANC